LKKNELTAGCCHLLCVVVCCLLFVVCFKFLFLMRFHRLRFEFEFPANPRPPFFGGSFFTVRDSLKLTAPKLRFEGCRICAGFAQYPCRNCDKFKMCCPGPGLGRAQTERLFSFHCFGFSFHCFGFSSPKKFSFVQVFE